MGRTDKIRTSFTGVFRYFLYSMIVTAGVLAMFVACDDDPASSSTGPSITTKDTLDKTSNWFTVDNTKYTISQGYVVSNATDTLFKSSTGSSGITLVSSTGVPFLTIVVVGQTIPSGTWSLPSESAYMGLMGLSAGYYFFIPMSPQNYLLSDKCNDAQTMIGGTLSISKVDTIYEIKLQGAKLATKIHQTSDVNDPHPQGTVTVSAYYKGPITVSQAQVAPDCGKGIVLPDKFLISFDYLFLKDTFAGIGSDFYEALDGFYKKKTSTWDLYEQNNSGAWVRKDTSVCPYKKCVLVWDPGNASIYTPLPSDTVLGISCRKYTYKFSDTTSMTYWVHPNYDIIMRYESNMIMKITYLVTSFSTTFSSWQEIGLTKP